MSHRPLTIRRGWRSKGRDGLMEGEAEKFEQRKGLSKAPEEVDKRVKGRKSEGV